ncbi:hypothetical protein YC2023_059470 [Brassica napus]
MRSIERSMVIQSTTCMKTMSQTWFHNSLVEPFIIASAPSLNPPVNSSLEILVNRLKSRRSSSTHSRSLTVETNPLLPCN